MKRLLFIATAVVAFSLSSCLSDKESIQYYAELGNLSGESLNSFVIKTDNDNVLKPQGTVPGLAKFEDGKRVLVQYSVVSKVAESQEFTVNVASLQAIFEKELLFVNDVSRDTLKNDPVNSLGAWIGKDYLNLEFYFWGTGRKEFPHYIDLVMDSTKQDKPNHIALDLTHNAKDDELHAKYRVLMSVSLEDLRVAGQDSVLIWLRANDQFYKPTPLTYYYTQED